MFPHQIYGGKFQPKFLPKFYPLLILFDEEVRRTCEELKIKVKNIHDKYWFYNKIPCEISHHNYQIHASFFNVITSMDQYDFEEVKWRGYDPKDLFIVH